MLLLDMILMIASDALALLYMQGMGELAIGSMHIY
jgi:hypothetical protein